MCVAITIPVVQHDWLVGASIGELGVRMGEGLGVGMGMKWHMAVLRPHFVVLAAVLLWR